MGDLTLFCLIVGGNGKVFPVDISGGKSVGHLKESINKKKKLVEESDADELELFKAKENGNGEFLSIKFKELKHFGTNGQDKLAQYIKEEYELFPGEYLSSLFGSEDLTPCYEKDGLRYQRIHILVKVPHLEPIKNIAADSWYDVNGIDLQLPYLHRTELVNDIIKSLEPSSNRFVLFSSCAASGKTSLINLLAQKFPNRQCIYISLLQTKTPCHQLLKDIAGINLYEKKTTLKNAIIMLDDAQDTYGDTEFWGQLTKTHNACAWLPTTVKFIISATHSLQAGKESPIEFRSLRKFTYDDFMLSEKEADVFLNLPLPVGLPDHMKKPRIKTIIIRECNGLVGALRMSINALKTKFSKHNDLDVTTFLNYYFSTEFICQLGRCFGSQTPELLDSDLKKIIIKCLHDETASPPQNEDSCYVSLLKSGILKLRANGEPEFSSPLSKKYYQNRIFPNRASENPRSLISLVKDTIQSFSSSILQQSISDDHNFPKETCFQHVFMSGLAQFTRSTTFICPELSKDFDGVPIQGAIDFYLNSELKWGIELLVRGDRMQEHLDRFSVGGKYYDFRPNDYAVVDFRSNKKGTLTNVGKHQKRITVVFKQGDYTKCNCYIGKKRSPQVIILKD